MTRPPQSNQENRHPHLPTTRTRPSPLGSGPLPRGSDKVTRECPGNQLRAVCAGSGWFIASASVTVSTAANRRRHRRPAQRSGTRAAHPPPASSARRLPGPQITGSRTSPGTSGSSRLRLVVLSDAPGSGLTHRAAVCIPHPAEVPARAAGGRRHRVRFPRRTLRRGRPVDRVWDCAPERGVGVAGRR